MLEESKKQRFLAQRNQAIFALTSQPVDAYHDAIQAMVELDLPPEQKYQEIDVVDILRTNLTTNLIQMDLNSIAKAFNILEKYGRNLLNPKKPQYWRSVKFNNPVFKNTVSAIQGGRQVLCLYGYSEGQADGLSFPDTIQEPDGAKVASVTVDVTLLRMELDRIIKGTHPHPEIFSHLISQRVPNPPTEETALVSDAIPVLGTAAHLFQAPVPNLASSPVSPFVPSSLHTSRPDITGFSPHPLPTPVSPAEVAVGSTCNLCGEGEVSAHCPSCNQFLCSECDVRYHKHPARADHQRLPLPKKRLRYTCLPKPSSGSFDESLPILRTSTVIDAGHFGAGGISDHQRALGTSFAPSAIISPSNASNHSRPGMSTVTGGSQSPDRSATYWRNFMPDPVSPYGDQSQVLGPEISLTRVPWECTCCKVLNEPRAVLCMGCDRPKGYKTAPVQDAGEKSLSSRGRWSCQTCTFENEPSAVLCDACKRPRLAGKPIAKEEKLQNLNIVQQPSLEELAEGWHCEHCTYWNTKPGRICEMCNRTSTTPAQPSSASPAQESPQSGLKERITALQNKLRQGIEHTSLLSQVEPPHKVAVTNEAEEWQRQKQLRGAGQKLVKMIRDGEENGLSPEEVYCAFQYSGTEVPVQWLQTELPYVLEIITDLAAQKGEILVENTVGKITQEEARHAWLTCSGNVEDAVQECINIRKKKVREIQSLGFRNREDILESLYMNAGDVQKALTDLQRKLLEPFHARIWEEQDPHINPDMGDKQRLLRQILAMFGLPSWGRAELVLNFLQENDQSYSLHDVVEAVRQSHDKQFIKRMLSQDCAVCLSPFPRNRMQSLTSCECMICPECFQRHFTIVLKERHIKDMVCPGCSGPEISDEDELLSYFSTLDIQLRDCLDGDAYELFNKKLTERTLMKDPKFKWCTHCSFGFIYDGDQMKVTCPQCEQSFCKECKRPWENQHQGINCEEFQNWKLANDPEYQAQGLAVFLKENGIDCPKCKFAYALAKGGCMHFRCSQCRHEFCSGCYNTFHASNKCTVPNCTLKTSLHAHHPRDCLSYLRDWDVTRLKELLKINKVNFNTEPPAGTQAAPGGGCRVMEQKEALDGLKDEPCGKETPADYAGLCLSHYKEYLVSLINGHSLDPAVLYDQKELEVVLGRYQVEFQEQAQGEDNEAYKARLLRKLTTEVALGDKVPRKKK